MFRAVSIVIAVGFILFSFNSCKKITEDQLVNGTWQLNEVYVDTATSNYLNKLPNFAKGNNCCAYKMDFQKDDVVLTYYLTYDTFTYVIAGNWKVPTYNQITIKLDNFMDGTFDILKPSPGTWDLTSSANHIKAFDGISPQFDTTYTKLVMTKI